MRTQRKFPETPEGLQNTFESIAKEKSYEQAELLREINLLQDSAGAIWRDITNRWFQEQVSQGNTFVNRLRSSVQSNISFIQNLVDKPCLQTVRVGLALADLDSIRSMATTGENWLATPHELVRIFFDRYGDELTNVSIFGEVGKSEITLQSSEGKVTICHKGNFVCLFDSREGGNSRYFLI